MSLIPLDMNITQGLDKFTPQATVNGYDDSIT